MFSIPDIVPLIINNLDIQNISSFRQLCKEANNIFDWNNYFLSKTRIPNEYNKYFIDADFMRTHGKYLMNVTDVNVVRQWFAYHSCIKYILSKYDAFVSKSNEDVFGIDINYENGEIYRISYSKEKNTISTTDIYTKLRNYHDNCKGIKSIMIKKLCKKILIYKIKDINLSINNYILYRM